MLEKSAVAALAFDAFYSLAYAWYTLSYTHTLSLSLSHTHTPPPLILRDVVQILHPPPDQHSFSGVLLISTFGCFDACYSLAYAWYMPKPHTPNPMVGLMI